VGAIALSSAADKEQTRWQEASQRESRRYNLSKDYVEARMQGMQMAGEVRPPRTLWDWILVVAATAIFIFFAILARAPRMSFHWGPAVLLIIATMVLLLVCGTTLWRTTRFN